MNPEQKNGFYFFERKATEETESGYTVSKYKELPKRNFRITEYSWGNISLWFVDDDGFSCCERQSAYESFVFSQLMALESEAEDE